MELIKELEERHKKAGTEMHPDIKEILHILEKLIIEENAPSPEPAPDPHVVMAEGLPDINIKFRELENKIDKLERDIKLCCPDFDEKARKIQTRFKSNQTRKKTYEELGLTLERYITKGEIIISPPISTSSGSYYKLSLKPLSRSFSDQLFGHKIEKDLVLYNFTGYPVYFSMEIYDENTKKITKNKSVTHFLPSSTRAPAKNNYIESRDITWISMRGRDKDYHKNKHYRISSIKADDDHQDKYGLKFWYGKSILGDKPESTLPYDTVYGITDENIIIIEKYKRLGEIYEEIEKYAVGKDGRIYIGNRNIVIFENKEDEIMFKKLYNSRKKLDSTRGQLKTKQKKYKRKKKKTKKHKKSKKYNK